jgi:energy-coupling factor transporter ATP-binding protein EcfA2
MRVQNFRSLKDVEISFQDDLTILIGENDSGKSSVLDALEKVLSIIRSPRQPQSSRLSASDYYVDPSDKQQADEVRVELIFGSRLPNAEGSDPPADIGIRVTFPRNNEGLRFEKLEGTDWVTTELKHIRSLGLPSLDRYRAVDYQKPELLVSKVLKNMLEQILAESDIREQLDVIQRKIKHATRNAIAGLHDVASRHLPGFQRLEFEPIFDFAEAYRGCELMLDCGRGLHASSAIGDGSKRRLLMAILEWQREVQRNLPADQPILIAYDEPDTNLDYAAQRRFFMGLNRLTSDRPHIQAILCTHSVLMIDSAPITKLVLLSLDHGITKTLPTFTNRGLTDNDLDTFLEHVATKLGLTNSALLFERCYFLVEGETEYNCLPTLYRRKYGRSMRQDGILPICLSGCGNAKIIWRFFDQDWKREKVVTLLDADAYERYAEECVGRLFRIGDREFEDAFSDEVWSYVLNTVPEWRRDDNSDWNPGHVAAVRQICAVNNQKFSEVLTREVKKASKCNQIGKPRLGEELGKNLRLKDIPEAIVRAFENAREIAGVT